jgi:hypothetical protein
MLCCLGRTEATSSVKVDARGESGGVPRMHTGLPGYFKGSEGIFEVIPAFSLRVLAAPC